MLADSYDVIIVGAGAAGCAAALRLPPGTRALLVDRADPDRERCCGGLLAPDAQAALSSLELRLPEDVRVQPDARYVHVYDADSGRDQTYRRDYVNVSRARFDAWLMSLASERVQVSSQTRFVDSGPDRGDILLARGNETYSVRTKLLIGADGANSAVRRRFFPDHPGPTTMASLQATLANPEASRTSPQTHEVLFSSTLTDFYAWAIPKDETVLLGCAFENTQDVKERFDQILAWYRQRLGLGDDVLRHSARRLSRPRDRTELFGGGPGVLLVGEAAGLVSPSSGEGISFALLSGSAAGRAAAAAAPDRAYHRSFQHLARRVMSKTVKAKVIYTPRSRAWALRLPWYP
ncbi:MAG: FAD-dependent monooxygenase [Thermoleophilia bacterium]|nr:FAD-dependent monooxygenase [Thermoleophilia bacterium]